MDKFIEQIPGEKHRYSQAPVHSLDFRRIGPPLPEPRQETHPKKVVHAYTLHARSNDRLKDLAAPVVGGLPETPLAATE